MLTWTLEDYLNHWKVAHSQIKVSPSELTPEMVGFAAMTMNKASEMLKLFAAAGGQEPDRPGTSGWRPAAVNALIPGAALRSKHMVCKAIDIFDPEGDLDEWLFGPGAYALEQWGLWQEHPSATKGWCHVQMEPYRSWVPGKPRWFHP